MTQILGFNQSHFVTVNYKIIPYVLDAISWKTIFTFF